MLAKKVSLLFSLIVIPINSNAALYDRGNGMIYDDVLDITWLQDTNYAVTSGYASNNSMTWYDSLSWVENLNYGGYDDWRLPSVGDPIEVGDNITTSELGYMYFINLGNDPFLILYDTPTGEGEPAGEPCGYTHCLQNTSFTDAETMLTVDFLNLIPKAYWFNEEPHPNWIGHGFYFNFAYGYQDLEPATDTTLGSWAVRDGDVSIVPVPASAWLFMSGLIGLAGVMRKN